MTQDWSIEKIEAIDVAWTNTFAAARGWEKFYLTVPDEELEIFFRRIPGSKVLDSGSGWGRYVDQFINANLDYIGLDYSEEMIKAASEANPEAKFVLGSFRNIPFPHNHFDGIWSCCALSGIPKRCIVDTLKEHHRVLKPSGVMLCCMPSSGYSGEGMQTDNDGLPTLYHTSYTLHEFEEHLFDAGFIIEQAVDKMYDVGAMYFLVRKD